VSLLGRRRHDAGSIGDLLEKSVFLKLPLGVACAVAIVAIMCSGKVIYRQESEFYEGQPAQADVIVDIDYDYVDSEKTDEIRQRASGAVLPVFRLDTKHLDDGRKGVEDLFAMIDEVSQDKELSSGLMVDRIIEGSAIELSRDDAETLLKTWKRDRMFKAMTAVIERLRAIPIIRSGDRAILGERIILIDGEGAESEVGASGVAGAGDIDALLETLVKEDAPGWARGREVCFNVVKSIAGANMTFDQAETEVRRSMARDAVVVPPTLVKKGKKIIERGNEVTAKDLYVLKAYHDALRERFARKLEKRWFYIAGVSFLVAALLLASSIYLKRYQSVIYGLNSRLLLLGVLIAGAVLLARILILIPLWRITSDWKHMFYYLSTISIPVAAILVAMLLDRSLSLFMITVLAIIVGIMRGFDLSFLLVSVMGGIMACYSVAGVRRRSQMVKSGLVIGVTYFIIILAACMMTGLLPGRQMYYQLGGGVVTGVLSVFIAMTLLPVFEGVFNITTDVSLVELSDLNHPLLKRMVFEAPGTYHHSLMVANLAESAAEAVGANALQVRVASYFHDIGKLGKPEYFSENEWTGKSKHDAMNPEMSSLIIIAHVKEGVELARKHKLGKLIVAGIREHHGTSLVYYFYVKAENEGGSSTPVNEEDFRYAGPKPQSNETAILLLADGVEAASRSLSDVSPESIEKMVHDIINDRLAEHQLDECDLTLRDLKLIGERFAFILNGIFHSRVRYPDKERGDDGGGADKKRPEKGKAS